MSMFESLNKNFESPFERAKLFDDVEFLSLGDCYENFADCLMVVHGFWLNPKSKFGTHGVAMVEIVREDDSNVFLNLSLPQHCNTMIEAILSNDEYIKGINAGACGAKMVKYTAKKYNKDCYTIRLMDI